MENWKDKTCKSCEFMAKGACCRFPKREVVAYPVKVKDKFEWVDEYIIACSEYIPREAQKGMGIELIEPENLYVFDIETYNNKEVQEVRRQARNDIMTLTNKINEIIYRLNKHPKTKEDRG